MSNSAGGGDDDDAPNFEDYDDFDDRPSFQASKTSSSNRYDHLDADTETFTQHDVDFGDNEEEEDNEDLEQEEEEDDVFDDEEFYAE